MRISEHQARLACTLFLLLWGAFTGKAQEDGVQKKTALWTITPPSPTVEGLTSKVTSQSDQFTGKVNVNIPLTVVKSKEITVPITLNYSSNGVRVAENCGWVGTGWSLSAGGVISRTVYGRPDEEPNGFYSRQNWIDSVNSTSFVAKYGLLQAATGYFDLQPDVYSFSIGEKSGSFLITKEGKFILRPSQNFIITGTPDGGFEIVDDDGVQYIFSANDEEYFVNLNPWFESVNSYTSSWNLSMIISPNSKDVVTFTYSNALEHVYQTVPQLISVKTGGGLVSTKDCPSVVTDFPFRESTSNNISYHTKKLVRIESKSLVVDFNHSIRKDIERGSPLLSQILVKQKQTNKLIEQFNFNYRYYGDTTNILTSHLSSRLFLVGISKIPTLNGSTVERHNFTYFKPEELPSKNSYAVDHWGFPGYGSQYMIPKTEIGGIPYGYADRNADTVQCKYGLLQEVVYPTGGKTVFNYESNEYYTGNSKYKKNQETITCNAIYPNKQNSCYYNEGSFTINEYQSVAVNIFIHEECAGNECDGVTSTNAFIVDSRGHIVFQAGYGTYSGTRYAYLAPDVYTIVCTKVSSSDVSKVTVCYYEKVLVDTLKRDFGGGARLKSIVSISDGLVHEKKYIYLGQDGYTSGRLIGSFPNYQYQEKRPIITQISPSDGRYAVTGTCDYTVITSNSGNDLVSTHGGFVGYNTVREISDDGSNGSVERYYSYEYEGSFAGFPFPPSILPEWKNGLLLEERTYDRNNMLTVQTTNYYQNVDIFPRVKGLKCGIVLNTLPADPYFTELKTEPYWISSGYSQQVGKATRHYCDGKVLMDSVSYSYSPALNGNTILPKHLYPVKEEVTLSNGSTRITNHLYVADFNDCNVHADSASVAINALVGKNAVATEIEKTIFVRKGTSIPNLVSAQLSKFRVENSGNVYLDKIYSSKVQPGQVQFVPSSIDGSGRFTYDNYYYPIVELRNYDAFGNLVEYKEKSGNVSSYYWSRYFDYPIFSASNVAYSVLQSRVVEEFGKISISSIDDFMLTLTYAPTGTLLDKWQQVNSNLRDYFKSSNAIINSNYTYANRGVVQAIDPKGCSVSYGYDGLNRLVLQLDSKKNITGSYTYKLYSDASSKLYYSIAKSGTFTKNSCAVGEAGSSVTYTINAGAYTSTVSQAVADQLALDDVNARGQGYANDKGICYSLNLGSPSLSYASTGGTQTETVTTNTIYSITSNVHWITVATGMTSGNGSIGITCSPNSGGNRSGSVIIQSTPAYGSISKTVVITQVGPYLVANPKDIEFDWLSGSQTVSISSSPGWSVISVEGSFITATKVDEKTLEIECTKNIGADYRYSSVTLSNGTQSVVITVTQTTNPNLHPQI